MTGPEVILRIPQKLQLVSDVRVVLGTPELSRASAIISI